MKKFIAGIDKLYQHIFASSPGELDTKFKDKNNFYSWLGGVHPDYRNRGIASKLMEQQHHYLRGQGYKIVQTKTMNKWRGMLLLNIQNGFDIVDTYTDEKGLHKIILEKRLQD